MRRIRTRVDKTGGQNHTWNDKFLFKVTPEFLTSKTSGICVEIYAVGTFCDHIVGTVRFLISNILSFDFVNGNRTCFSTVQSRRPSKSFYRVTNIGATVMAAELHVTESVKFGRAGISVKKEAPVNFLTDPQEGRSTLRPADVLVYGWVGGKHVCVDLTGISPLVGLGVGDFTVGQAALKATSSKMSKHEKACSDNQHVFIPFAFDTFGFLAPEAVTLLKRVQKVMHSNVV
ncbi:hypothetical protein TSUD_15660 [Trifolium subterraneum]|uniref:C2 domain-containing protein n=1 Tax=Trifolium subterraneum TaxID=3900 RepID=A0A2Z6N455_TRISU|nr:hypothetical protein TSUD_15660 [Trifolium subterraneum]